jgi:membrane protein
LLEAVVPHAAYSTISGFLDYVSQSRTELMLTIGITAMVTSSAAAFRSFTAIMGDIQRKMRFTGFWKWLVSFVFSVIFLGAIYASALIIVSGEWLMHLLVELFSLNEVLAIWAWIRYVILFFILFAVIFSVYLVSAPKHTTRMSRFPGALAAAVILVVTSIFYSQLISASIRYEVLYGSLASFIVLMVWLFTCALILILANVLNIAIGRNKEVKNTDRLFETGQTKSTK